MNSTTTVSISKWVLPIIIFSQFCCTSLWFAGNSIIEDLILNFNLSVHALGDISSAVQFGFIIGTFLFALFTISDRYKPSRIFFICALLGAAFNLGMLYPNNSIMSIICFRFLTGFCLAGIYPVGMKIAADYFEKGLGKSLSFLVGALVLGTAFPHLIKSIGLNFNWKVVVYTTSILASVGGILILVGVSNGPYQKLAHRFDASKIAKVFKNSSLRSAAIGYFGHMWELYAFWTFVPTFIFAYSEFHSIQLNISLLSFIVIGSGFFSCILGGYFSLQFGVKKVAALTLSISGFCCLLSPLIFSINSSLLFVLFLIIWGMVVIADSPLFSSLVAQNSESTSKGTSLTIVNCIGFAVTIISIQMLDSFVENNYDIKYLFVFLALGPLLGLLSLKKF